jgi:NAD(P)-dependent dehydrogenase (short-subunit alcohol dehydrogenase family)
MPSSFTMSLSPCFTGTQGSKLEYHQLDISKPDSVAAFASWLKQQHGKLDILVNNAGALFVELSRHHIFTRTSCLCKVFTVLLRCHADAKCVQAEPFLGSTFRAGQAHNSVSERLRAAPA